jgi:hypothetical protein
VQLSPLSVCYRPKVRFLQSSVMQCKAHHVVSRRSIRTPSVLAPTLDDCPCRLQYRLKTILPPCGNRNFSKVAGPPIQKTSFTVAGPLAMWAQPITVEYQKSDLSLFPVGAFCLPLLRNLKVTQFRRLSSLGIGQAPFDEDATAQPRHDTITDAFGKSNAEAASPAVSGITRRGPAICSTPLC